jgi:vacuolar protein sorting-associated protein 29
MVTGHTHQPKFNASNGINFINPGSMTGAFSVLTTEPIPSFIILEVKQTEVIVYSYSLVGDEIKCDDSKFDRKAH